MPNLNFSVEEFVRQEKVKYLGEYIILIFRNNSYKLLIILLIIFINS